MARLYHVDIARHAARADHKWVDNLLSHFSIPGVESGRQGTARRIAAEGIEHVALVRLLTRELDLAVRPAVDLAIRLLAADEGLLPIGGGLEVRLDRATFQREIHRLI